MNSLNKIFIFTFILSISFASDLSSKNRKLVLSYNDEWISYNKYGEDIIITFLLIVDEVSMYDEISASILTSNLLHN